MLIIHPTIEEKLKNKHEIENPRHVVSSLFGTVLCSSCTKSEN